MIHRGYLPRREEVEAYAARVFTLIDHLLDELGDAALHAELAQEQEFLEHFEQLPAGTPATVEEHPGMFRARRFGPGVPAGKAHPLKRGTPQESNSAAEFQQRLAEFGTRLSLSRAPEKGQG
ncbi:hypothetical protein ACFP81_10030 [Deinococcus lacus]|uniref:Uncharacterized protein n=1 Tax=Deinococcus lacus TaxID=392561 RepID=A0ABW1YFT0_9DEIO